MRSDLDGLMEKQGIDALWVIGDLNDNPDMVYFTGVQQATEADLFKMRGKAPVLFHFSTMEREEAAKSGLHTEPYFAKKPFADYIEESKGDVAMALAQRVKEAMASYGLESGKIAISGKTKIGPNLAVLEALKQIAPEMQFTSFVMGSPFSTARMTKEADEIARIRDMGTLTTEVIGRVQEFLQNKDVREETLVFEDGKAVTIRDVKEKIRLWVAELGADNPHEAIFSLGRDAAIPHNTGNLDDAIVLGKPIVFDIYPCETGGGYFYDITRTWCFGYASEPVQKIYDTVKTVFDTIIDELEPGVPFMDYQTRTCALFKEMGHITVAEDSTTQKGYLHSLGHGVGLNVHEKPFSGFTSAPDDILKPGVVFTVEPGLYYPDDKVGVRIEDTIYLREDGIFEKLAHYPYDLVIPMKKK